MAMAYVTLYYRGTLRTARQFICRSLYKHDNGYYEFRGVHYLAGYELSDGRATSNKFICCKAEYDIVVLYCLPI